MLGLHLLCTVQEKDLLETIMNILSLNWGDTITVLVFVKKLNSAKLSGNSRWLHLTVFFFNICQSLKLFNAYYNLYGIHNVCGGF